MEENNKPPGRWQGYSVEDCSCKYCLFYIGIKRGEVVCAKDVCPYQDEMKEALSEGRIDAIWK